jgi:hypothetical protein
VNITLFFAAAAAAAAVVVVVVVYCLTLHSLQLVQRIFNILSTATG